MKSMTNRMEELVNSRTQGTAPTNIAPPPVISTNSTSSSSSSSSDATVQQQMLSLLLQQSVNQQEFQQSTMRFQDNMTSVFPAMLQYLVSQGSASRPALAVPVAQPRNVMYTYLPSGGAQLQEVHTAAAPAATPHTHASAPSNIDMLQKLMLQQKQAQAQSMQG